MKGFTADELEAIRLADEEIERDFRWTNEELEASRERDRVSIFDRKDVADQKVAAQKVAAQKKAWYEANREKVNEKRRRKYREKRIRDQDGV